MQTDAVLRSELVPGLLFHGHVYLNVLYFVQRDIFLENFSFFSAWLKAKPQELKSVIFLSFSFLHHNMKK